MHRHGRARPSPRRKSPVRESPEDHPRNTYHSESSLGRSESSLPEIERGTIPESKGTPSLATPPHRAQHPHPSNRASEYNTWPTVAAANRCILTFRKCIQMLMQFGFRRKKQYLCIAKRREPANTGFSPLFCPKISDFYLRDRKFYLRDKNFFGLGTIFFGPDRCAQHRF